ncbi:hypothetical protein BT96DRAFT_1026164 [Gymnopus androsaceus JB14]|uniref:Peptide hydrolase n=1 Tax=Gymnopus androsaceus JB14 TaxID=1447944 RepID=A0A6A4GM05_9AGAR|nr:hypothetical protein BT96DRAFT_1026164 [Gymnopus androsaceus JB14]
MPTRQQRLGFIPSILLLSPVLIGVPLYSYREHVYIGYRTTGTFEHARGEDWLWDQVSQVKHSCDELVSRSSNQSGLECEIWHQKGSSSHRFDMMGSRLYKTYVDLGNIVLRLSSGTAESKAHSVLVNAHLDSTLPSPGAADDAIIFNNAEESLQDGSHLFSTQHEVAQTVRAVMNLEAAGTTGRDLLFQATSEEMIEAYSHVPYPFGTVVASDVFSSGIVLSDTDFRQFEGYLGVTGLDMAIVGNSYLYHMRKDLVENIQPGVAQNFGENTLALLLYLSSPPSGATANASTIASLTRGYTKPTTVYFSLLGNSGCASIGLVVLGTGASSISGQGFAKPALAVTLAFVGCLIGSNAVALLMKFVLRKPLSWFRSEYSTMVLYGPPAVLGALLSQLFFSSLTETETFYAILLIQSLLAVVIQSLEIGSAALFFLSASGLLAGLVMDPVFVSVERMVMGASSNPESFKVKEKTQKDQEPEHQPRLSLLTYALALSIPLSISASCAYTTLDFFVPLAGRIGANAPADNLIATIVAGVGALGVPLVVPFVWRFQNRPQTEASRGETGVLKTLIIVMALITAVPIAIFSVREPFDSMHQKRVYVMRTENITTGEHHLHLSTSDGAPGFKELVYEIAKDFGAAVPPSKDSINQDNLTTIVAAVPEPIIMDKYNSDWDPMFPFSLFLRPYKIPLPVDAGYVSPWASAPTTQSGGGNAKFSVTAENDVVDLQAGTRTLKLVVSHPGLIWTVIAFDAHVLKWNLDDSPPDEYTRHHVKEASYYGSDTWSLELVIKLPSLQAGAGDILVNFIGLEEEGMWPGKKAILENYEATGRKGREPGLALTLFSTLDAWFEERTGGKVDALLLGCVAGVQRV